MNDQQKKKLDADAHEKWDNIKGTFLEEAVDQMLIAGTSAEEYKAWDDWQYLKSVAEDIRRGITTTLTHEDPEVLAIAGVIADWMQENWKRYQSESLKKQAII